jgi:dihydrofolate reductase
MGRKTYELFADFWPEATTDKELIADRLNEIPKIVFSNTISKAPWGKWQEATVIDGEATTNIKTLKSKPGKNMVLWGSLSLAHSLMEENLVDEFHLQVCPVITGGGRTLFSNAMDLRRLHLSEVRQYNTGNVFLNYQPVK